MNETAMRKWIEFSPAPVSRAASRIVTSHSDFHPANIVRAEGGLKLIDHEFSCVMMAVYDLSWVFSMYIKEAQKRRAFAKAYLEAFGDPAGPDEVDSLILDAQYCQHGTGIVSLVWQIKEFNRNPSHSLEAYEHYK